MRETFLVVVAVLCLGGFAGMFLALRAAFRGRSIRLPRGAVDRDRDPAGFWVGIVIGALLALMFLRGAAIFIPLAIEEGFGAK